MNDQTSGNYIERAYYHDYKGRVIQTVEKNHLGGISRVPMEYEISLLFNNCGDFATKVLKQDDNFSRKTPGIGIPAPWILIGQYSANSDYDFLYSYGVGITVNYNDKTVQYDE